MRPTTAFDDNVFDFNALLHPGPSSIIRGTCWLNLAFGFREARHPGVLGIRCIGDRLLSRAAGACRA